VINGDLAAVEVGRDREKALGGELVDRGSDLLIEAPPLLQNDHALLRAITCRIPTEIYNIKSLQLGVKSKEKRRRSKGSHRGRSQDYE